MKIVEFGVRKPVAANLVMFAIIASGLIFGADLRREFFPETRPNEVLVAAPYPGAAPDEIEDSLAIKIEDQLVDLDDVEEINTIASEGSASVRIEFKPGIEIEDAVARVKREMDALEDLPENSERIVVEDFEPKLAVVLVTLHGDLDERTLKSTMQEIRDDLRSLPGMGEVQLIGVRGDEITVEVDQAAMLKYEISLPFVSERVRAAMSELPGGAVRTPTGNVALRTLAADERADEIREIVIKSEPDGRPILLGEIAKVREGFADVDLITRFNNEPAASLRVYAQKKQDIIEIAKKVRAYVAGREREAMPRTLSEEFVTLATGGQRLPHWHAGYELGLSRAPLPGALSMHSDLSRFIQGRLDLLTRNAFWGGVLVFLTLILLLRPRVAFWVTVGLIISLLGTLVVMRMADISLNLLTMFGLIVVLGLLVDDAIVVAENITAHHERGSPALTAAIDGANQVKWPVIATIITTICAFMPLRLIEGRIGDMLGALPIVVLCALAVSLIECLFILPSHMAHDLVLEERRGGGRLRRIEEWIEARRARVIQGMLVPIYTRMLRACLMRRYLTMAFAIAILIGSFGLVAGGRVPFTFMAASDSEFIAVDLRMPIGTPVQATERVVQRIESAAVAMPEMDSVFAAVGAMEQIDGSSSSAASHLAQVWMELRPVEERDRESSAIIEDVRQRIGPLPGIKSLKFQEVQGGPGGSDITYTVVADRPGRITEVVDRLKLELANYEGVYGITDDSDRGQRELRMKLREGASELGYTTASAANQLRGAVFGLEPHTFAGTREDVDVRVMIDERTRRSLSELEAMHLFTPDSVPVPLREVMTYTEERGYATIRRLNGRRAITVTADVNESIVSPEDVTTQMQPMLADLRAEYPGMEILARGRQEDMADSFRTLPIGMLAAIGAIYVILAWLFSSYVQPLVVITAVPFAAVGAVWGHLILGYEMTMLSLIGFVALTGIVVNDSLILMEFYNGKRRDGLEILDALLEAGRARLRAILLTTLTTVLGLSPLMLEQSFQAKFLIPMAITISFGLIAATMVTLVILPCLLLIHRDVSRIARFLWTGHWTTLPVRPVAVEALRSSVAPEDGSGGGST